MKLWNHYHTPASAAEAVDLLARYAGQARIIAGGTDLLVEMRDGYHAPHEALVDVTRIPELRQIAPGADFITVGAGVTHTQIVKSPELARYATCLVESCGVVGGPQVRNVGTLGGNVAHALPAGDGTTSLVALDAEADIIYMGERKRVPIREMYVGPGKSLLDSRRDLLLSFRFRPAADREATAFKRIMRPQGVALPILGCGIWVRLDETRSIFEAARIAIAPIGPTPGRADEVEHAIIGQPAAADTINRMAELAQATLHPRTSKYRATADYRQEMIGVLVRRTLMLAVHRAQTGDIVPEGVGA